MYENYLILSNCAVDKEDKNVSTDLIDAINLQKNPSLLQAFNFNVVMDSFESSLYWFASTQEGLLWFDLVSDEKLVIQGSILLNIQLGSRFYIRLYI